MTKVWVWTILFCILFCSLLTPHPQFRKVSENFRRSYRGVCDFNRPIRKQCKHSWALRKLSRQHAPPVSNERKFLEPQAQPSEWERCFERALEWGLWDIVEAIPSFLTYLYINDTQFSHTRDGNGVESWGTQRENQWMHKILYLKSFKALFDKKFAKSKGYNV